MKKILISRTDNLGDVALTLPLCGLLRSVYPESEIHFLCKNYTAPLVKICRSVSAIHSWDNWEQLTNEALVLELKKHQFDMVIHVFPNKKLATCARKAGINKRVGTISRFFHWYNCNLLPFVFRKHSGMHESQLNIKLVKKLLNINKIPPVEHLVEYVDLNVSLLYKKNFDHILSKDKFNIILHPKSFGSANEWPASHFRDLIESLGPEYQVIITGTESERLYLEQQIVGSVSKKIVSLVGQLDLVELMSLIAQADGLVAASTGPLHIAGLLGINTLGLFPPNVPMYPLRWIPIGERISFISHPRKKDMFAIKPDQVKHKVLTWDKLMESLN
jgi:ADP-heptose:LPS heptosyltransferase